MKNLTFGVQELSGKETDAGLLLTAIAVGSFWFACFIIVWKIGAALGEKSRRE